LAGKKAIKKDMLELVLEATETAAHTGNIGSSAFAPANPA
jgi:hypothetical protein